MAKLADPENQFSLLQQEVIVQSTIGIFYGVLEKSDTRIGTVLLSNGYMLTPGKHMTYLQYLDVVTLVCDNMITKIVNHEIGKFDSKNTTLDAYREKKSERSIEIRNTIGNSLFNVDSSVPISKIEFTNLVKPPTIVDYATEGVAMIYNDASDWSEYDGIRPQTSLSIEMIEDRDEAPENYGINPNGGNNEHHVKLISLTDVQAIVPISIDNELVCISPIDYSEEAVLVGSTFSAIGPNSMLRVNTPKLVLSNENQ